MYRTADLFSIGLSGALSLYYFPSAGPGIFGKLVVVMGVLLAMVVFPLASVYGSWRGRSLLEQSGRLVMAWLAVLAVIVLLAFSLGLAGELDRRWLLSWLVLGSVMLAGLRGAASVAVRMVRARGWNHKRVVVVGSDAWALSVVDRICEDDSYGLDVVAMVNEDSSENELNPARPCTLGGLEQLPAVINKTGADEVWICLPVLPDHAGGDSALDRVLWILRHSTVTLRLVPNLHQLRLLHRPITSVAGVNVFDLNVSPMGVGVNRAIKALEDWVVAGLLLLLTAPIMALIAAGVKLSSPGPVLFKQVRHGWNGKPIKIYKFRTMYVHREESGTVTQARKEDARITRLGAFLRRTSLDELPQFFNVLQGRMSVVGPRPHAVEHNHYYMDQIDSYMQRHRVKPGITGWAQVNGLRGETNTIDKMRQRVEHDLFYIENWSLAFDIKIILMTIVRGFRHPNAY
jgi:putative colanic acid biosynthesis UDP-glucose lipid carrier transferase